MRPDKRKEYILTKLNDNHSVKIQDLSFQLKVTRETIRKDLYDLESAGLIKKIHGGAVLEIKNSETDYEKRKNENWDAKEKMAKMAVTFIEESDTVYLDYGTTTLALAKEISKLNNITVVTNTIPIVNILLENRTINIVIPGGMVRNNEFSLYGEFAVNAIKNIYVNIGFFGCSGLDDSIGLTTHHTGENIISKGMIKQSQTSILLADQSKFGIVALNKTAFFDEVDIIITDRQPSDEEYNNITQNGTELLFVE